MRLEKILFYVVVSECGMCKEFEYGVLVVDDMQTAYKIEKQGQEETIIPDPSYDEDAEQTGDGMTYDMTNMDEAVQASS